MRPGEFRATQHYEEFIVREWLDQALTVLSEDAELGSVLER